jgi:hypothetical protein
MKKGAESLNPVGVGSWQPAEEGSYQGSVRLDRGVEDGGLLRLCYEGNVPMDEPNPDSARAADERLAPVVKPTRGRARASGFASRRSRFDPPETPAQFTRIHLLTTRKAEWLAGARDTHKAAHGSRSAGGSRVVAFPLKQRECAIERRVERQCRT